MVPARGAATAMPFAYAVGTSLVVVTALGLTTATSYALSGHVDWLLTALLIAGGVGGAALGILLGRKLAAHKMLFERAFARSEEHTSELQSLMRISYAVFCLKKKKQP